MSGREKAWRRAYKVATFLEWALPDTPMRALVGLRGKPYGPHVRGGTKDGGLLFAVTYEGDSLCVFRKISGKKKLQDICSLPYSPNQVIAPSSLDLEEYLSWLRQLYDCGEAYDPYNKSIWGGFRILS